MFTFLFVLSCDFAFLMNTRLLCTNSYAPHFSFRVIPLWEDTNSEFKSTFHVGKMGYITTVKKIFLYYRCLEKFYYAFLTYHSSRHCYGLIVYRDNLVLNVKHMALSCLQIHIEENMRDYAVRWAWLCMTRGWKQKFSKACCFNDVICLYKIVPPIILH